MKTNSVRIFLLGLLLSFFTSQLMSQTIKLVPNQPAKVVTIGNTLVFNGDLFAHCLNANNKQDQFVRYDGTNFTTLANPTQGKNSGIVFGYFVPFNGQLVAAYGRNGISSSLAVSDGGTVSLVPKSAPGLYLFANAIIPGNLYYPQLLQDSVSYSVGLERFNGTKTTFISAPSDISYESVMVPFVFNNDVYAAYFSSQTFKLKLTKVTGNRLTVLTSDDFGTFNLQNDSTIFNGQLWGTSLNALNKKQLTSFNGTKLNRIANPDNGSVLNIYQVYKNRICFSYRNAAGLIELGTYDGSMTKFYSYGTNNLFDSFRISPSIVYNNVLYFQNANTSGKYQLAKFNGAKVTLIKNPDNGKGVYGYDNFNGDYGSTIQPVLCYGNLYVDYINKTGRHQLAQYDGNNLTAIPNLSTSDTGYSQHPVVYKNKLYFIYIPVNMGPYPPTLAYLDITGKETNTGIANKAIAEQNNSPSIYPNPAKNIIHLSYKTNDAEILLQIFDMNGDAVLQNTLTSANSLLSRDINIASLPAGKYTLQLKTKNSVECKGFIKE